ncbi:MAG: hypothetical protein NXI22_13455 [bacterium]|nr:hypothetical protein [bacterium]
MADLVTVASCDTVAEADTVKLVLEREGFEVYLSNDGIVAMDWLISNAVGGVLVQVPDDLAEKATKFMSEYREREQQRRAEADLSVVDCVCHACGAKLEFAGSRRGRTEDCPKCGAFIDVPEEPSANV